MDTLAFASFAVLVLAWLVAPNARAATPATAVEQTAEPVGEPAAA